MSAPSDDDWAHYLEEIYDRITSSSTKGVDGLLRLTGAQIGEHHKGPDAEILARAVEIALADLSADLSSTGALDDLLGPGKGVAISPDSPGGQNALLLLRVHKALYAHMGGDKQNMRHWMLTPNSGTGGTPAIQIQTASSLEEVVKYLEAL